MKPILFNTEMVKAILDGRKTQTRRVVKESHLLHCLDSPYRREHPEMSDCEIIEKVCPPHFCTVDILYVRETWRPDKAWSGSYGSGCEITYKAGGTKVFNSVLAIPNQSYAWHPSIHMPKEAARIFLRVTDVRVERLHEMSFNDLCAEGILTEKEQNGDMPIFNLRDRFAAVWNSTIKPADLDRYGWEANPWVWVYEFEKWEETNK